jgi:hypothetical protein
MKSLLYLQEELIKMDHIKVLANPILDKLKSSKPSENISSQETEASIKYPDWLEEIFYLFNLIYGQLWGDKMPTHKSKLSIKLVYYSALISYSPQTIKTALLEVLRRCKYPPNPSEMVSLCEEFKQTGWKAPPQNIPQISIMEKTLGEKDEAKKKAEEARKEIRRICNIKEKH